MKFWIACPEKNAKNLMLFFRRPVYRPNCFLGPSWEDSVRVGGTMEEGMELSRRTLEKMFGKLPRGENNCIEIEGDFKVRSSSPIPQPKEKK